MRKLWVIKNAAHFVRVLPSPYPLCPHLYTQKATYWNPFISLWLRSFVCLWEQAWPACWISQKCRKVNSPRRNLPPVTNYWVNILAPSPPRWVILKLYYFVFLLFSVSLPNTSICASCNHFPKKLLAPKCLSKRLVLRKSKQRQSLTRVVTATTVAH